jgi:predicted dienelactone hydrolase
VVVIPNHQGSTSGDSTPETTIPAVWERPADIGKLLDAIAASPSMNGLVDLSDVTALGFSLGGVTVLTLAGAQFDAANLAAFCDSNPQEIGCPWLAKGNALIPGHVDLHQIDATRFNASYLDSRIRRFVAVDPEFVPALNAGSLRRISSEVQIVNLGDFNALPTGVRADHVASAIANAKYDTISGANHFDFLGECHPLGWFYIWLEGDDPVCTEIGIRSRAEIHEEIARKILAFLKPDQM